MKAWFDQMPTEARWVVGAFAGAASSLVIIFVFNLAATLFENLNQIGQYKPRIARMLGYEATAQELQTSAREFSRALDALAYSSEDDANSAGASKDADGVLPDAS